MATHQPASVLDAQLRRDVLVAKIADVVVELLEYLAERAPQSPPRFIDEPKPEKAALLDAEELARELRTTRQHVYSLIHRKHTPLPAKKIGRFWRFDLGEVRAWLDA